MSPPITKKISWLKRKRRVRKKIEGNAERPRLNIYRSNKHIYAQVIDDASGHTHVAVSSLSQGIKGSVQHTGNIEAAKRVGVLMAQKCLEKQITQVVFDRSGYLFHGRVKAVAQAARENGLHF